jgi:hypothetical protein
MIDLQNEIAAFERMRQKLEAEHFHEWAVFNRGELVGLFPDFEAAATLAVERFEDEPCLIRQVGAGPIQLPGGMVFRPAHALDTGGL